jgi:hypothetical protein
MRKGKYIGRSSFFRVRIVIKTKNNK